MTLLEMLKKARIKAKETIDNTATLTVKEHKRLNQMPTAQAIRDLTLTFLEEAVHIIENLPC